ncbi:MAG: DUF1194 domain-containing protein [Proteobacteria bacterium]|nr:DUF1194 domain-containing protein [Pseudomonadota bacterium]
MLALLASVPLTAAVAQVKVDLELILMADGSGSVDEEEFALQRSGYARALRDPRIINAIQSGPSGGIALAYVEWSGPGLQVPVVDWTHLRTKAEILAFAKELEEHPRELYGGGTAVGSAIEWATESLSSNKFDGRRRVIDVSGDRPDRHGLPADVGRDRAVAKGITINGLPILEGFFGLQQWFQQNVIGGPGAFSIPARGFNDVGTAIRLKLIREIAGRIVEQADAQQSN